MSTIKTENLIESIEETKNHLLNSYDAAVKKEYLKEIKKNDKILNLNFVSEDIKKKLLNDDNLKEDNKSNDNLIDNKNDNTNNDTNKSDDNTNNNADFILKRQLNNDSNNRDEYKKRQKILTGQNKGRNHLMTKNLRNNEHIKLCSKFCGSYGLEDIDEIEKCSNGNDCKFSHDVNEYMKSEQNYLDGNCYMFDQYGVCVYGHRCKFGKSHIDDKTYHNLIDKERFYKNGPKLQESYKNQVSTDLKFQLRKKKYDFSALEQMLGPASIDEREWKKIDFSNKLYLAPLTTVGNLPFRRICKDFKADVTCGEMTVAQNIVDGHLSEWALLKRHSSEDLFGVQLVGSNQQTLAKATKLINDTCQVDFIDLNLGCPIDMICRQGGGSALMTRANKLNQIITSMSRVSNVPLTLKLRTGYYDNKFIADKLIDSISNQFSDGRISLITVHGRSREGRYTRANNWDYIQQCANISSKIPIFGSGDVFSFRDYEKIMNDENNKVSGVMIGRGALIKPWIFTEIKERRDWDISSKERLDIVKTYVNYGLEYFGSDREGVEKTRRFLLEFLSFSCRYIPVGLLEFPQRLCQRPPAYFGRDELETLLASSYCEDWIKISEMFLGKVSDNFVFLPKHKANAFKN